MFSMMRMPGGDALLIRVRDESIVGIIHKAVLEDVSQALGIGVPVRKAEVTA